MADEPDASATDAVERGPEVERDRERRVRERAYEIWEQEGRPDARSLDHWLSAKQELETEIGPDAELAEDQGLPADPAVEEERRARFDSLLGASD